MVHVTRFVWVALALLIPSCGAGQTVGVPSDSLLAAVTMRGTTLAAYDRAAWLGTDALMALRPNLEGVNTMLAFRQTTGRWIVYFARLNADRDSLLLLFEATETNNPDRYVARELFPAMPLDGDALQAARALDTARADFGEQDRPYNSYVLPHPNRGFWVYFMPAQTDVREFPHGADLRYEISASGDRIFAKWQMHRSLLNSAVPEDAALGLHTVVTEDMPQDSDVFLVLTRTPRRPEVVVTEHHVYHIAVDGSITWRRR